MPITSAPMTSPTPQAEKDKQLKGKNTSIAAKDRKLKELSAQLLQAEKTRTALERHISTLITDAVVSHAAAGGVDEMAV